jgi:thiol-disulfide isomerase/thioredoxin
MIERSIRPLRKALALLLSLLLSAVSLAAQKQPTAQEILKQAQSQAAVQHKLVFLILGASWCGPCHRLDRLLAASDVQPIIAKYFVVAKINVLEENGKHPELNTPGGNDLGRNWRTIMGSPTSFLRTRKAKCWSLQTAPLLANLTAQISAIRILPKKSIGSCLCSKRVFPLSLRKNQAPSIPGCAKIPESKARVTHD